MTLDLAKRRDVADGAATLVPFVKDAVAARDEQLKRLRSERDFAVASIGHKENKVPAQIKFWRLLGKITSTHTHTSPVAEQLGSVRRNLAEHNTPTVIKFLFRRPITGQAA